MTRCNKVILWRDLAFMLDQLTNSCPILGTTEIRMKTYTPELDPAALQRLSDYAALFADDFPQAKPARWSGVYLQGLLLDGDRKSIEPMARRVRVPAELEAKDREQA